MIRTLILKNYGKFRDRRFDLRGVTVFAGPNEAGKTTVFDALAEQICAPLSGNARHARNLRDRYGAGREAAVEREDNDTGRPSMDDFLGLYAIRSGDLAFDISDSASWMAAVKANLFDRGVNPQHLKEALETLASADGTLAHNRALKKAEKERADAERELAALRASRDAILQSEGLIRRYQAEAEAKEHEARKLKEALEVLTRRVEEQERIQQRVRLEAIDRMLHELRGAEQALKADERFGTDRTGELDRLTAGVEERASEVEKLRLARASRQESVRKLIEERQRAEQEAAAGRATGALAGSLLDRIAEAERLTAPRPERHWRWGVVAACLAVAVASGACAAVLPQAGVRLACAGLAVVALVVVAAAGSWVEVKADEGRLKQHLERYLDEWNNARPGADRAEARTMEGFRQLLMEARAQAGAAQSALERLRMQLEQEQQALGHETAQCETAEKALAAARQAQREWLASQNVGSRDEYVSKAAEFRTRQESLARVRGELELAREELGCRDVQDLEREVARRLRDMDEAGVARTGMSAQELQVLRRQRDEAVRALEALTRSAAELQRRLGEQKGHMQGSLGQLPQRIAAAGRALEDAEKRIAELMLNRKAAGVAAELVREMCAQTDQVFGELAGAIRKELAVALGEERTVTVDRLDQSAISVADAAGASRRLEFLSRGTRDCFVLAARLALARRAGAGAKVLVLDEPFLSLDDTRRPQAVTLLKRFREQTGWQLVVFTKERALVGELAAAFAEGELVVHDLQVQPCDGRAGG